MLPAIIVTSVMLGFCVFFAGLWFFITTLIGVVSGWSGLVKRYPDSGEEALKTLSFQTGRIGSARYNNILTLAACPSGLRVRVPKLFSPFGNSILAPWSELSVRYATLLFGIETAVVSLGSGGRLQIYAKTAKELAAGSAGRWSLPPAGPAS